MMQFTCSGLGACHTTALERRVARFEVSVPLRTLHRRILSHSHLGLIENCLYHVNQNFFPSSVYL